MSEPVIALCPELGRRAREAALRGERTFSVPEAAGAAALIAADAPDPALREEARAWLSRGAPYHELVRLSARTVASLGAHGPPFEPHYGPKAAGELEPMLALWPYVLVLPMTTRLSRRELIELRAFPVHPLGLVTELAWAEGTATAPSEYFFHDLDLARFKLREDLLALGIDLPDAYREGTTLDPSTGRHRTISWLAHGHFAYELWDRAPAKLALARRLLEHVELLADPIVAQAAELLLFEIIHENSFPLEAPVLERELRADAHLTKLRSKHAADFFGSEDPGPEVVAALPAARSALEEVELG